MGSHKSSKTQDVIWPRVDPVLWRPRRIGPGRKESLGKERHVSEQNSLLSNEHATRPLYVRAIAVRARHHRGSSLSRTVPSVLNRRCGWSLPSYTSSCGRRPGVAQQRTERAQKFSPQACGINSKRCRCAKCMKIRRRSVAGPMCSTSGTSMRRRQDTARGKRSGKGVPPRGSTAAGTMPSQSAPSGACAAPQAPQLTPSRGRATPGRGRAG